MRNQAVSKEAMERYLNVVQGFDQTIKINNQSLCILKLQHFARIDREARAEGDKWAAAEKAKYESERATMEAFRAYEKVLYAGAVKQWQDQQHLITTILTAPFSIEHAAETDALIKTRDDRLKLQDDLIDAYQTQLTRGTLQMEENTNKYRADLSDEATKHRAEITRLYDRIAALVDSDGDLQNQLRAAAVQIAMHVAAIAAKDTEMATAIANATAAVMAAKDAEAAAATTAKDAEIARLTEELAAFRLAVMEA